MNINNEIRLYLISGGYPVEDGWHFFTPKGEVIIEECNNFLSVLLPMCDGHTAMCSMKKYFQDEEGFVKKIEILLESQILVDANRIYEIFYAYSKNPMPFSESMTFEESCEFVKDKSHLPQKSMECYEGKIVHTNMHKMLNARQSTRSFKGIGISVEDIFSMLWSAYGVQSNRSDAASQFLEYTYTVPSGGALYPLLVYVILLKECAFLKKGIYYWHKEVGHLSRIKSGDFSNNVCEIITGIEGIEKATGVICVAANFERTAKKYGNKAYNLIQQEVGHVMQNIALFCAENNLGVVEIGGYDDEKLASILEIDFPNNAPLITAAFGPEEKDDKNST